jgi:hypothetical protein
MNIVPKVGLKICWYVPDQQANQNGQPVDIGQKLSHFVP